MLRKLNSVKEYLGFVDEINRDERFSEPMLSDEEEMRCNLLEAPEKPANHIFGVFDGEEIIGLFVFLILEEESYIEMITGLSRREEAYAEMLSFLKEHYQGYQADFVYNPGNILLHEKLRGENAVFDTQQQKMVLKREVPYQGKRRVELYSPKYREQYMALHSDEDRYWTAEKVIDAPDRFRILLALEGETVVGYIDVTHKYQENEPYDVFVREGSRRKGYAKAMLAKAIELNRPRGMMLLVEVDNAPAIALYRSLGFETQAGADSVTAHVLL